MYKGLHVKRPLFLSDFKDKFIWRQIFEKNIQEEDSLYQQIGLKFEEETSKMLH